VRLQVSLTTLLVLYTLSVQVSSVLPPTAYIKMIDIWFFFCITLLFFIILFHVFIEYIDTGFPLLKSLKHAPVNPKSPMIPTENVKAKKSEMVSITVRIFVIPIIVIIFNIVFWSCILLHN
ncbi:unnamed protein product, partial [Meganyctiphanes norvegica]